MGGFDIGGLFSALKMDDSEFLQALERSGGASKVFQLSLDDVSKGVIQVYTALQKAGYEVAPFSKYLETLIKQGYDSSFAMKAFTKSLDEAQGRIRSLQSAGALNSSNELINYRSLMEAERIRNNSLQQEFKQKQDYANLTNKLRAQEAAGIRQEVAATNEGYRQEAVHRSQRDAERTASEQSYLSLVNKLRKEEADAAQKYGKQIENDNRQRQQEMEAQWIGAAQGQERIEREKAAELARIQSQAQQRERAMYFEHRRQMQTASALTSMGMYATVAGAAGLGGMLFTAKEAADFQDAMTKSLALIGDVSDAMRDRMAGAARELAKETGKSAKEIAGDYGIIAKAGFDASTSITMLPTLVKYSVANNVELHDSTKQVLTVMESLSLGTKDVSRVTDEMTLANKLARGSVESFAQAMEGRAGGALRAAHVSLEQALAMTVAFARAGIEASQSQTYLAQTVQQLIKSAQGATGEIRLNTGTMERWHDVVYDAQGNMRSLSDILNSLNKAFSGSHQSDIDAFFNSIHLGGARGSQGLKVLLGPSGALAELEEAFKSAGGQVETTFDKMMKSPMMQLKVLERQLQDLAITVGIPVVSALQSLAVSFEPVLKGVQSTAQWFAALPPGMQTFVSLAGLATFAALSAGGSILTMAGALYRLRADMILINGTDALGGVMSTVGGLASKFFMLAVAIGVAYAAWKSWSAAHEEGSTFGGMNVVNRFVSGVTNGVLGSGQKPYGPVMSPEMIRAGELSAQYDKLFGGSEGGGNSVEERVREVLEKYKDAFAAASKSIFGDDGGKKLFSDPEKELRKQLKLDSTTQALNAFSERVKAAEDKIGASEAAFMQGRIDSLMAMLKKGTDPRIIEDKMHDLEGAFKIKTDIAAKLKADETLLNKDAETRLQLMAQETGWTRKMAEGYDKLTKGLRDYESVAMTHGNLKQENPTLPMQYRLPSDVNAAIDRMAQIQQATKDLGITSQESMNASRIQAEHYRDVLVQLKADPYDIKAATVAMWEAEARAAHVSADSISSDYRRMKDEVTDSVKAANKAWAESVHQLGRDINRTLNDFISASINTLSPLKSDKNNPANQLAEQFRGAFSQLSMYSNPKAALSELINSIKNAGDIATANATAVKYFGQQAGPLLAHDLRSGAYSASQIADAINTASLSTAEYQKTTEGATDSIAKLWRKLCVDVSQMILKYMIEQGLLQLIKWLDKATSGSKTLQDALAKVFSQLVGLLKHKGATAAVTAATTEAATTAAGTVGAVAVPVAASAAQAAGTTAAAGAGAAGAAGAVASSLMGTLNTVFSGLTAIASIGSFINGMRENTILYRMETDLRGILNVMFLNGPGTLVDCAIRSFQELQAIHQILGGTSPTLAAAGGGAAGSGSFNIYIENLNVQSPNVDSLVSELKRRRIVQSR